MINFKRTEHLPSGIRVVYDAMFGTVIPSC